MQVTEAAYAIYSFGAQSMAWIDIRDINKIQGHWEGVYLLQNLKQKRVLADV